MASPIDDTVPADDLAEEPGAQSVDGRRLLAGAQSPTPPAAGDRVGRYVLIRRLGAGGMGVVFAAYDPKLDRRVALKLLRTSVATATGSVRERTLREARALARLVHPAIVAVLDADFHQGELYIVSELVEGESVRAWLAASPRPVASIIDVFRQAAVGLSAAHAQQIDHRAFTGDNMLLGRDGRVRVADVGLVHVADTSSTVDTGGDRSDTAPSDAPTLPAAVPIAPPTALTVHLAGAAALAAAPSLTVTGAREGTPAYLAPEQLDGGEVDARADQFAFGVSLWSALYGAPPWTATEVAARREAMAGGPPPDPATARGVPAWLRAIVRRTLAPAPEDRFASMEEVVSAIDHGQARRRQVVVAASGFVIAGLVSGAIALGAVRPAAPAPCGGGGALIRQVWNPARAVEIRAQLAARGVDVGALTPLFAQLDGYGRDWAAEHSAACVATRLEKTQTEQALDQRMACLDRARATMRAVVDALADGRLDDPERRATGDDLPPIAACAERETQGSIQARPSTVDQARLEDTIARTLDAKLAVYDIARADATTRSEAALAHARATGWAPLIADAALVHGELLRQRGRHDEARPYYDEALREALRGSHPGAQAEIMASLAHLESLRGRHDDAQAWIERALALVSRLGDAHELELRVLGDAFAVALAAADLPRARAFAEREEALATAEGDRRRLADALLDQGRLATAEGRYDDAVATLERAMAVGGEVVGPSAPWMAIGLELQLEPLIALGRTRDARAAVERAIAVRTTVYGPDDPLAVDLYAALGAVAQRHGDLAAARAAHEGSVPRAIATYGADSTSTAMAIANLAMVDAEAGDHARAETGALQAQGIFERKLGAEAPELIEVLVLRAHAARGQRRFADARGHLDRARAISTRTYGSSHPGTLDVDVELAHTDRLDRRLPAAIERYQAVLGATDLPPPLLAEAAFGLAQARWDHRQRATARAAATTARNAYELLGEDFARKRAEVDAWLAAHPAP